MSMSLRDQLLAAGLGTKKQAKQAPPPKKAPSRHQPPPPVSPEKLAANRALAAKNARDQELNRRQQEKAAAKARRAEVKQLIEQYRLPKVESEEYFNFTDGTRLARLPVTPQLREQVIRGAVAIVRYEGHYALVPEAAVGRIRERDEHAVVTHDGAATPAAASAAPDAPVGTNAPEAEDPYKDFVVPDDLVW
jgi:uncharacterized protein YaiL (DUF2058 family)